MSRKMILNSDFAFIELILRTYEARERGIRRLFFSELEASLHTIEERINKTRSVIKAKHAVESETLPLFSVLDLQVKRAEYLAATWIDPFEDLDPGTHGWKLDEDGTYQAKLQDEEDDHYLLPKELLKGCSCKTNCMDSKRCSCRKSTRRSGCSRITCKLCSCFKTGLSVNDDLEEGREEQEVEDEYKELNDRAEEDEEGDEEEDEEEDGDYVEDEDCDVDSSERVGLSNYL